MRGVVFINSLSISGLNDFSLEEDRDSLSGASTGLSGNRGSNDFLLSYSGSVAWSSGSGNDAPRGDHSVIYSQAAEIPRGILILNEASGPAVVPDRDLATQSVRTPEPSPIQKFLAFNHYIKVYMDDSGGLADFTYDGMASVAKFNGHVLFSSKQESALDTGADDNDLTINMYERLLFHSDDPVFTLDAGAGNDHIVFEDSSLSATLNIIAGDGDDYIESRMNGTAFFHLSRGDNTFIGNEGAENILVWPSFNMITNWPITETNTNMAILTEINGTDGYGENRLYNIQHQFDNNGLPPLPENISPLDIDIHWLDQNGNEHSLITHEGALLLNSLSNQHGEKAEVWIHREFANDTDIISVFIMEELLHQKETCVTEINLNTGHDFNTVLSIDSNLNGTFITGAGDDELYLGYGEITSYSGAGNDKIFAYGAINNRVFTGDGDDEVTEDGGWDNYFDLGDGNDVFQTGGFNNEVHAGNGDDRLVGYNFNEYFYGDAGDDYLDGGDNGEDVLHGGAGNDTLYGGYGDDVLYGGDDDDILIAGIGQDSLTGGAGNDQFFLNAFDDYTNTINDFTLGEDVIKITDLLFAYDPLTDAIEDFLAVTATATGFQLKISLPSYGWFDHTLAEVHGSTLNPGTTAQDLIDQGALVIDNTVEDFNTRTLLPIDTVI